MSTTTWAMIAYGFSGALALLLLYMSGPSRWYLHVLSVVLALALGLAPIPAKLNTPQMSIVIGVVFFFLFLWGVAAPLFHMRRRRA